MNKTVSTLANVTAGLSFVYAALYLIADITVFTSLLSDGYVMEDNPVIMIAGILSFLLFFVMLTLGIIMTVFTAKLPAGTPGKGLLLAASIMTIAGFIVGLINVIRWLYLITSGVLFVIGAVKCKKVVDQNSTLQPTDPMNNQF